MAQKSHNAYVPGYDAVSHHEMRTAENSAAYLLPTLQEMVKANNRLTLLDVGAGSGTISASLAKYMPSGHLTATDLSPEILAQATAHAAKVGATNIDFQSANTYELPFPDASFDVVHTHQMLCHLDAPVDALKELLRVTKPGGVVAVREVEMTMWTWWPRLPGLQKFHDLLLATHAASGSSNTAGSQLLSWAMRAGARREQITATMGTWNYSTPRDRGIWATSFAQRIRSSKMGQQALDMGLATQPELESMAQAWEEWMVTEDACFGCMHGELLIRK